MPSTYCTDCGKPNHYTSKMPTECISCGGSFIIKSQLRGRTKDVVILDDDEYFDSSPGDLLEKLGLSGDDLAAEVSANIKNSTKFGTPLSSLLNTASASDEPRGNRSSGKSDKQLLEDYFSEAKGEANGIEIK